MKAFLMCVVAACLMSVAAFAFPPEPPRPVVRAVWLPQMPLLGAVQPARQERHDKHKDDDGAYCFNPKSSGSQLQQRERDPHAHQCACHLTCQLGPNNEIIGDSEDRGSCL